MVIIDGTTYDVPVSSLQRKAEFLDKYAQRVESGDLQRDLIGVYFNYTLQFTSSVLHADEYQALWNKLTDPVKFHDIKVPDFDGYYTFKGYVSNVSDEILWQKDGKGTWKNLSCDFIAKMPAKTPK